MTASYWTQVKLNLWKSWLVRKRKPVLWASEVVWPLLMVAVICLIHVWVGSSEIQTCHFRSRANPSAGTIPYLQSTLCNLKSDCHNAASFEDIPSYPGNILVSLVREGGPIFMDEEVNAAVSSLPTMAKLAQGLAVSLNTSEWQAILDDRVPVHEAFRDEARLERYLVDETQTMDAYLARTMIQSHINLTRIVELIGLGDEGREIVCNQELISFFVHTDDPYALQRLTHVLCNLDDEQLLEVVSLIHRNIDFPYVLREVEKVAEDVSNWSLFDLIGDFGDLMGIVLTIPTLWQYQDDIPPVVHLELWLHDFEDWVESVFRGWQHIDWTVLDSVAALTLEVYLYVDDYELVLTYAREITNLFLTLLEGLGGVPIAPPDGETFGPWESLANSIEDVMRKMLNDPQASECLISALEGEGGAEGLVAQGCDINKLQETLAALSKALKELSSIDYIDHFIRGLLAEFQAEDPTGLVWLQLYQPMLETAMITPFNASMSEYFITNFWPGESVCLDDFSDLFIPPPSFVDETGILPEYLCLLISVANLETDIETIAIDDPLIQTILDIIDGNVPPSDPDSIDANLEELLNLVIAYDWPRFNRTEFGDSVDKAKEVFRENTWDDIASLLQAIFILIEQETGNIYVTAYANASLATLDVVARQMDTILLNIIDGATDDEIRISISELFADMPHTQLVVDHVLDLLPSIFTIYTPLVQEEQLLQLLDDWLLLTWYGWPCGEVSILDIWTLPEADHTLVQELEYQLCQGYEILDEFENLPIVIEIGNIFDEAEYNGEYAFDWTVLVDTFGILREHTDDLIDLAQTRPVRVEEFDLVFVRSTMHFASNMIDFFRRTFEDSAGSPDDVHPIGPSSVQDIVRCLDPRGRCLHGDIYGFASFWTNVTKTLEKYDFMSSMFDYTFVFDVAEDSIPIVARVQDLLNENQTLVELHAELVGMGMKSETAQEYCQSWLNVNRLSFLSFDSVYLANSIRDPLLFSIFNKYENKTIYEYVRRDMGNNFNDAMNYANIILKYTNETLVWTDLDLYYERQRQVRELNWIQMFVGYSGEIFGNLNNLGRILFYLIREIPEAIGDGEDNPELGTDLLTLYAKLLKDDTIRRLLDTILGTFDAAQMLVGSNEVSVDIRWLRNRLNKIGTLQLVEDTLLGLQMQPVMKDWDEVAAYFHEELGLEMQVVASLALSDFEIAKVFLAGSGAVFYVSCDADLLREFLILPEDAVDVTIADIGSSLCHMELKEQANYSVILFEEVNVEGLVGTLVSVSPENICENGNVTYEEGKASFDAFVTGLDKLSTDYSENIQILKDAFAALADDSSGTDLSVLEYAGLVTCGERTAFKFVEDATDDDDDNDDNGGGGNEAETDPCLRLKSKLEASSVGNVAWNLLAPILQGEILYTPESTFTSEIVARANQSYADLEPYLINLQNFLSMADVLEELSLMGAELEILDRFIHSSMARAILEQMYGDMDWTRLDDINLPEFVEYLQSDASAWRTIQTVNDGVACYSLDRFRGVESESNMENDAFDKEGNKTFLAGIVFLDDSPSSSEHVKHAKYKIRMGKQATPSTHEKKPKMWTPGPKSNYIQDLQYLHGFVQLQDSIDRSILDYNQDMLGMTEIQDVGVYTQQQPYPCFGKDSFLSALYTVQVVQICLFFGFCMTLASTVRFQVWEKESQNLQIMDVMGMRRSVAWVVWIIMSSASLILLSVLLTIILKWGGLLPFSDPSLIFFLLFTYSLSLLMFCFVIATIMHRASTSSLVAILLYIVTFIPFVVLMVVEGTLALWHKLLAFLMMSTSFSYAAMYMTRYEQQGVGLHWNNVWQSPIADDDTNFGVALLCTFADAVIYLLIALTILYFQRRSSGSSKKSGLKTSEREIDQPDSIKAHRIENSSNAHHQVGVSLRGLTKTYQLVNRKKKVAVDHLDLDFNIGEVTGLLGHNGAGKSTTMKMLTGLEPPSSGQIQIMGLSYPKEWSEIQKLIGFCPQDSILFPDLSAREHLLFYGKLKGVMDRQEDIAADADSLIQTMAMEEVQHQPVKTLSEGMQRRVCVSLAFIGGSKVVVLDEPTVGVDPIARRYIWKLIDQHKHGRVIILTTQHLDEAEILSDRIAVIHMGRLLTLGTIGFLKERFGSGYQIHVSLKKSIASTTNSHNSNDSSLSGALEGHIRQLSPRATLIKRTAREEIFFLPGESEGQSPIRFLEVIQMLESETRKSSAIENFAVTSTTLEHIFLALVNEANGQQSSKSKSQLHQPTAIPMRALTDKDDENDTDSTTSTEFNVRLRVGFGLRMSQMRGLLYKRFKHMIRDWRFIFFSFGMPAILMVLCLSMTLIRSESSNPAFLLTPNLYGPDASSFVRFDESSPLNSVLTALLDPPGLGTTCMPDVPDIVDFPECLESQSGFSTNYTGPGSYMTNCDCSESDQAWQCNALSADGPVPRLVSMTTDHIFDISGIDVSINRWILNTHQEFIEKRYGGWSLANRSEISGDLRGTDDNMVVWYDNNGPHALPSYVNSIHNAILRAMVAADGDSANNAAEYGITTYVHPMAVNDGEKGEQTLLHNISDYAIAFLLLTAFSFFSSSLVTYLIAERRKEEKQVQIVAGVSIATYWFTALIWDLMITVLFVGLSGLILLAFGITSYTSNDNFLAVLLLLFFYCTASISSVYCLEKLFREPSVGQLTLLCSNVLLGVMTLLLMVLLEALYMVEAAQDLKDVLQYVLLVLPPYALGDGLLDLATNQIKRDLLGESAYAHPLSFELLGRNILFLGVETVLLFVLNLALEYRLFNIFKRKSKAPEHDPSSMREGEGGRRKAWIEDEDVREERLRVQDPSRDKDNVLTIRNLTKNFSGWFDKKKIAVDNVSVGIQPGECFGLLGLNSAGKSTTFKMLAGALDKSAGSFHLSGHNTLTGYCPQEDALDDLLTVREMLKVYCLVRGISWKDSEMVIGKAIKDMSLDAHTHTKCEGLSGGTKRKLCTAVALMGNPQLIFMDEPTSGMDVLTRRQVAKIIRCKISSGCSVVLTSHAMEECEQLCTRLAIMSEGRFQCLGSPSHLKQKYSSGFTLRMTTRQPSLTAGCLDFVRSQFPDAANVKRHHNTVTCRIGAVGANLGEIYAVLLKSKEALGLVNFSANPTTLDEVFINFSERTDLDNEGGVEALEFCKL